MEKSNRVAPSKDCQMLGCRKLGLTDGEVDGSHVLYRQTNGSLC